MSVNGIVYRIMYNINILSIKGLKTWLAITFTGFKF